MHFRKCLLLVVSVVTFCEAGRGHGRTPSAVHNVSSIDAPHNSRGGKLFNLFNVVTFKNGPCSSTESSSSSGSNRNGTCLTSTECSDKGGTARGNCAAGFGVCCVFILTGTSGTITQNCTYIQNTNFPSALSDTNSVSFTVQKCSDDVCDLRLDFETFTTVGTGGTLETTGGVCTDMFTVTAPNSGQTHPTICGENSGQHIYVNLGNQNSDTATINFAFTGTNTARRFDIKVTQVDCTSRSRPPDGCFQYQEGTTGRIMSFNFAPTTGETHLQNQEYSHCIRQEAGFCCVQYQVCPSTTDAFSLSTTIGTTAVTGSLTETSCTEDYIILGASSNQCNANPGNQVITSRYCGIFFNDQTGQTQSIPICDCNAPFKVDIRTENTNDGTGTAGNTNAAVRSRGVCLDYQQLAC